MIEIIPNKWAIASDSFCVTVYERHKNQKTGEESWAAEYYYSDYKQALAGMLNREIMASGLRDFAAMVQAIKDSEKAILEAISEKITGNEERFNHDTPIS